MPVTPDVPTSDPSLCETGASSCLPRELLAEIFERIPLPVVVDRGTEDAVLNTKARSLWQITDADSSSLPVVVDGETQSLLTLLAVPTNGVGPTVTPHVRLPGGEQYEVDVLPWKRTADSRTWRLAILRPLDQSCTEDRLLTDKMDRLKAIVHEFRNTLTAAREALAFLQEGAVGELNAEQRRFLNSAMEDLERLVRALVDLTSLWVTRAGVLRMVACPVDIRRVVEQTTLGAQPVAIRHGISLRVEIGDPPPI